jgi:hypothetical protein
MVLAAILRRGLAGIAAETYREVCARLGVARAILATGWDGSCISTAAATSAMVSRLPPPLRACESLMKDYGGNLNALHATARDAHDLECRVRALGKGIGEVTAGIFLRELRGVWSKADPAASELALAGARDLGFIPRRLKDRAAAIRRLRSVWRAAHVPGSCFADFEAALVRHGIDLRHSRTPAAT